MTDAEQKKCKSLICRYKKKETFRVRDKIFLLLKPELIKWIKSVLGKRGKYLNESEILSETWDIFEKGVSTYKKEYPIAKHFHITVNKHVRKKQFLEKKQGEKEVYLEDLDINTFGNKECSFITLNVLVSIKAFYEILPTQYQAVFEDALSSLRSGNRDNVTRVKEIGLPAHRYYESKKIFRWIINFLNNSTIGKEK